MNAHGSHAEAASSGWPAAPEGLTLIRARRAGGASVGLMRLDPGLEVSGYHAGRSRADLVIEGSFRRWDHRGGLTCRAGTVVFRDPDALVSAVVGREGVLSFGVRLAEGVGEGDRSGPGHPAIAGLTYRSWRAFVRADGASALELESLAAEMSWFAAGERGSGGAPRGWLTRTVKRLDAAPERTPTLDELAEEAGVHFTHLARTFRRRVGCTPGEYLRLVRLRRVAERLAGGDEPIASLALAHGFADQSHLGRHFKRVYADTPARFRRRMRR
ncbi:MAG: AraC family transcriptional regulator [Phycisphaerales bacterium]